MSGSDQWAVPRRSGAHPIKHSATGGTLLGTREDYIDPPDPITYTDSRDGGCRYLLAGVRCPGHVAHRGAHGVRMRTETGLDFYVTWQPLETHQREGVDVDEVRAARDLDAVWALITCDICGNGVNPLDRDAFLRDKAHALCLADEAHDLTVHLDAEEHFG